MRVEQILVVDGSGKTVASCMISRYGPRWWMYGIIGSRWFEALPQIWFECKARGMSVLEGYISPAHARIVSKITKGRVAFHAGPVETISELENAKMRWVSLTSLNDQEGFQSE